LVFTREKTQPISPSYRRKKERIVKPRTPMEAFERVRSRDAALAASPAFATIRSSDNQTSSE
jgi:hypothetical protein